MRGVAADSDQSQDERKVSQRRENKKAEEGRPLCASEYLSHRPNRTRTARSSLVHPLGPQPV